MHSDNLSDDQISNEDTDSTYNASNITLNSMDNIRIAQLAAAGPIGMAAAAAIASCHKSKNNFEFETNPTLRKRLQTRLLKKLKTTLNEYSIRIGQQAALILYKPSKSQSINPLKIFGSQPLQNVLNNWRLSMIADLEKAFSHTITMQPNHTQNRQLPQHQYELPAMVIDGIPTCLDKMTQAQLRGFIPHMLKYATGRGKPGWGRPNMMPVWWPKHVPWANVRADIRSEEEKHKVSWTEALKEIIRNCYTYYGREDLIEVTPSGTPNALPLNPAPHDDFGSGGGPLTPTPDQLYLEPTDDDDDFGGLMGEAVDIVGARDALPAPQSPSSHRSTLIDVSSAGRGTTYHHMLHNHHNGSAASEANDPLCSDPAILNFDLGASDCRRGWNGGKRIKMNDKGSGTNSSRYSPYLNGGAVDNLSLLDELGSSADKVQASHLYTYPSFSHHLIPPLPQVLPKPQQFKVMDRCLGHGTTTTLTNLLINASGAVNHSTGPVDGYDGTVTPANQALMALMNDRTGGRQQFFFEDEAAPLIHEIGDGNSFYRSGAPASPNYQLIDGPALKREMSDTGHGCHVTTTDESESMWHGGGSSNLPMVLQVQAIHNADGTFSLIPISLLNDGINPDTVPDSDSICGRPRDPDQILLDDSRGEKLRLVRVGNEGDLGVGGGKSYLLVKMEEGDPDPVSSGLDDPTISRGMMSRDRGGLPTSTSEMLTVDYETTQLDPSHQNHVMLNNLILLDAEGKPLQLRVESFDNNNFCAQVSSSPTESLGTGDDHQTLMMNHNPVVIGDSHYEDQGTLDTMVEVSGNGEGDDNFIKALS